MRAPSPGRYQRERRLLRTILAPIGGDNTTDVGTNTPMVNSVFSYNLIHGEHGLQTRSGWYEWCTDLDGPVRSLLPFTGSKPSMNRLFACTYSGIWDVTGQTASPTRVLAFPTTSDTSGWGTSTVVANSAGHWLCYTDEQNGYWVYRESDNSWTFGGPPGAPVTGVDPAELVYVHVWKNRVWLVKRDSGEAYYLGVNAVGGAATIFDFGVRFRNGGDLRGLWSWALDPGSALDDQLVAISGGGDVAVYAGTDPSNASTFGNVGTCYVGAVPVGRRLCADYGGDLLVMSSLGISPLSKLMLTNVDRQYQTNLIARLFSQLQASTVNMRGWAMCLHPKDAVLMVLVPNAGGVTDSTQLVMSLTTKGWHRYRKLPIGACATAWNGTLYFGTADGRVCVNDGTLDNVLLANPNAYQPIEWSFLSAFSSYETPSQKCVQEIKLHLLTQSGPTSAVAEAKYDLDMGEAVAALTTPVATSLVGTWDQSRWDQSKWGPQYVAQTQVFGAQGQGATVAVAAKGSGYTRTVILQMDVAYELGGWL